MKMDNYAVEPGDSVFDVIYGIGQVDRVLPDEDRIWVRFDKQLRSYNSNGVGNFAARTLYWKDPVLHPPHKLDDSWDTVREIHSSVANILRRK